MNCADYKTACTSASKRRLAVSWQSSFPTRTASVSTFNSTAIAPATEVHAFFHRFAAAALATDEYRDALASCPFVSATSFELSLN